MSILRPPRLQPGDPVAVVAASGPVDRERFSAGAAVLGNRYELRFDEAGLFRRSGFLAGDDDHRLNALNAAIADPSNRAIILARGGYGLTRILAGVDRETLRSKPKPIVGYSDVTSLLCECVRAGVAAVHGPMVSDFAGLGDDERSALYAMLENPQPGKLLTHLETMVGGCVQGTLLGGNLEILSRLIGTSFQPDFRGVILAIEDVGEAPYRIDRLLTYLNAAGVLEEVAGVVVGDFTDCEGSEEGDGEVPSAREVLAEHLEGLRVPVVLGGGFGHGDRKLALPVGVAVELDAGSGVLRALEGAVS